MGVRSPDTHTRTLPGTVRSCLPRRTTLRAARCATGPTFADANGELSRTARKSGHARAEVFFCRYADPITGEPGELYSGPIYYPSKARSWYVAAKAYGKGWTTVYPFSSGGLGITAYKRFTEVGKTNGEMAGVIAIDYRFDGISSILKDATRAYGDEEVIIYVAETNSGAYGYLIGISLEGGIAYLSKPNAPKTRVLAVDCNNTVVKTAAQFLEAKRELGIDVSNEVYINDHFFVQSVPVGVSEGILWEMVTIQKVSCLSGYYEDAVNAQCSQCGSRFSSAAGSTSCDQCIDGYFWNYDVSKENFMVYDHEENWPCEKCRSSIGMACPGGTNFGIIKGYWATSPSSLDILECPYEGCLGNVNYFAGVTSYNGTSEISFTFITNLSCAAGHHGPKCASCQRDGVDGWTGDTYWFSTTEQKCKVCEDGNAGGVVAALLLIIALIAAVLGGVYMASKNKNKVVAIVDTKRFQVVWAAYQIINSADWSLNVSFPEPFASFSRLMSLVTNFSFAKVLPMGCLATYDHYSHLLVVTLVPTGLATLFALGAVMSSTKKMTRQFIFAMLMLAFLVLPTSATAILQLFHCEKLDDGGSYLYVDYSISCDSSTYAGFKAYVRSQSSMRWRP